MIVIDKYNGCELVDNNGLKFFYPDGDEEFVRQLSVISMGDADRTYYKIGKEVGLDLKTVFRKHVRSTV